MKECYNNSRRVFLSTNSRDSGKIVDCFIIKNHSYFKSFINNSIINSYIDKMVSKGLYWEVVSFKEDDISGGMLKSVNVYFSNLQIENGLNPGGKNENKWKDIGHPIVNNQQRLAALLTKVDYPNFLDKLMKENKWEEALIESDIIGRILKGIDVDKKGFEFKKNIIISKLKKNKVLGR